MRRLILLIAFATPLWFVSSTWGDRLYDYQATQPADQLSVALLGQSIIRYDLRRESPESAQQMSELLSKYDVVFTNFEAVIDDGQSRPTHTGLVHSALPEALDSLKSLGVNLLALSNNHSWDRGAGGVLATIAHARERGFAIAGTGANIREASTPGFLETKAGRVALVALASGSLARIGPTGAPDPARATEAKPGVLELGFDQNTQRPNEHDRERILMAIRRAAQEAPHVLVYHHNHYDEPNPQDTGEWKQQWARDCVDAGATIYVSHGTTWIRGIEIYKGRPIFHGLVNFIFQVRRPVHYVTYDNGATHPDAWTSVVASLNFDGSHLTSLTLTPLVLHEDRDGGLFFPHGAPRLARGEAAASILRRFSERSKPFGTDIKIQGDTAHIVLPKKVD